MRQTSSTIYIVLFALLCIGTLGAILIGTRNTPGEGSPAATSTNPTPNTPVLADTKTVTLPEYQIAFEYPSTYFISTSTKSKTGYSLVLLQDTEENRNLGNPNTPPRDGPVSITLSIYPNPKQLSAPDWTKQNAAISNYAVRKTEGKNIPSKIAAHNAFQYEWSGLYEGESYVVVNGNFAYGWSVSFNSPDDQIRKDFEMILKSVEFSIVGSENPSAR